MKSPKTRFRETFRRSSLYFEYFEYFEIQKIQNIQNIFVLASSGMTWIYLDDLRYMVA